MSFSLQIILPELDTGPGSIESPSTETVVHLTSTSSLILNNLPALPEGWEERQDANGRTFYINHVARITQWHHPGLTPGANPMFDDQLFDHQVRFHISLDESRSVSGSRFAYLLKIDENSMENQNSVR